MESVGTTKIIIGFVLVLYSFGIALGDLSARSLRKKKTCTKQLTTLKEKIVRRVDLKSLNPTQWWHKYRSFEPKDEKKFVVLICSYNNKNWVEKNLDSVRTQDYKNYDIVYVDDCSDDGTADLVEKYIESHKLQNRFTLIRSSERKRKLYHQYHIIHQQDDEAIIVELNGDDWLYHNQVLTMLNKVYKVFNAWLTYGRFLYDSTKICSDVHAVPFNIIDHQLYRSYRWITTHLKTYYAWLFKKIEKKDLMHEGVFFPMATDVAIMMPMLEMSGYHSIFIPDLLYIYNDHNQLSNVKTHPGLQESLDKIIRAQDKYSVLSDWQAFIKHKKG